MSAAPVPRGFGSAVKERSTREEVEEGGAAEAAAAGEGFFHLRRMGGSCWTHWDVTQMSDRRRLPLGRRGDMPGA